MVFYNCVTCSKKVQFQQNSPMLRCMTEDRRPKTEDRRPKTEDRRPKTEDRRLGNQLNEMCYNAFFDAKTMKSIRSSFCSFTPLKLQNEDPRWGLRFVVLPSQNYKTKTLAKTLHLTLKKLKSMGSSFCSFSHLKLQNEDPR